MRTVKSSFEIVSSTPNLEELIETAGRTAWRSEDKVGPGTARPFIQRMKNMKHESVLEHGSISVVIVCDRGITHELVQHRVASFTQESTRYCNYSKDKFGREITCIEPDFWADSEDSLDFKRMRLWEQCCEVAEQTYFALLDSGSTPQEARCVLPNSLATRIVITANPREWRHIFKLRCDKAAHPQMREIMLPMRAQFGLLWPAIFNDD